MQMLRVSREEMKEYDRFIQSMPNGSFRQGFAWGEVMAYDNEIIRLALKRDDVIIAAISLQKKRIPGTSYCYLYAPRGPVVDFNDEGALQLLMAEIREMGDRHNAIFLRIDPDFPDEEAVLRHTLQRQGFVYLEGKNWSYFNYPRVLMRLNTRPPEDVLLKGLRKKHRQHINNAGAKGIVFETVRDEAGLREFYGLMTEISIRKRFPLRSFEYYKKLTDCFGEDIRIILARHRTRCLGGVMSLVYGNKCWYMHGATVQDKGDLHPAEGLHWEIARWAKQHGCIFYDLGGTGTDYPPQPDNSNYSLYHFKRGFGADLHLLTGYYDLVFNKTAYRIARFMEERALKYAVKTVSLLRSRCSPHE